MASTHRVKTSPVRYLESLSAYSFQSCEKRPSDAASVALLSRK